ncbi:hypothetical protein Scep_019798 [Stephania cephalantha]|uniref:Endonuclease/exonuclease/phosphatase domain-containing protein n=1 Tax=Stephania cephalantha TaxID=152367 RepID=A0AAP0IBC2_9MAGN
MDTATNEKWRFVGVYMSSHRLSRINQFQMLQHRLSTYTELILLIGDWNSLTSQEEKFGGITWVYHDHNELIDFINSQKLTDLGFDGPMFTWTNRIDYLHRIGAKLDRALATHSWCDIFPGASFIVLDTLGSDHLLLLVDCKRNSYKHIRSIFRFDKRWLKDESLRRMRVGEAKSGGLLEKTKNKRSTDEQEQGADYWCNELLITWSTLSHLFPKSLVSDSTKLPDTYHARIGRATGMTDVAGGDWRRGR